MHLGLFGLLIIIALIALVSPTVSHGQDYIGRIGDQIDYSSGALSLSETDVTVVGRHGLDIQLTRRYSSAFHKFDPVDSGGFSVRASEIAYSEQFRYLGLGWTIGYPYLDSISQEVWVRSNHKRLVWYHAVVSPGGGISQLFANLDPATNLRFPKKTQDLALFGGGGPKSATDDTLLLSDGTRWIFTHRYSGRKYMTKVIGLLGDTLKVEYYTDSPWIKRVTSPIGRVVKFRYGAGTDTTLFAENLTPPDTARLCALAYLNHAGDTLQTRYRYVYYGNLRLLSKVYYPSGDSASYAYTDWYSKQDVPDWVSWYSSPIYMLNSRILASYTAPGGASVNWQFKYVNRPIAIDTSSDVSFQGRLAVIRRVSEGDTVQFRYQGLWYNIISQGAPFDVLSKTVVTHNDGGVEECFFFMEVLGYFDPSKQLYRELDQNPMWPGALYHKNSFYGRDTLTVGYSYPGLSKIGQLNMSQVDYYYHVVDGVQVLDSTRTIVDQSPVYTPRLQYEHEGIGTFYAYEYGDPNYYEGIASRPNLDKNWVSHVTRSDSARPNLEITTVSSPRSVKYLPCIDSLYSVYYNCCPWPDGLGGYTCTPREFPADSGQFVRDTVLEWQYVPNWNLVLVKKIKHLVQNKNQAFGVFQVREYDSTKCYQLARELVYLDTTYFAAGQPRVTDTLIRFYVYDSYNNLVKTISSAGDTVHFEYDSLHAFLYRTVDSSLGALSENLYYPNGKLKQTTDLNGGTTYFFYDHIGRDSLVRAPLETDFTSKTNYDLAARTVTQTVKIDSGLYTTSTRHMDQFLRDREFALSPGDSSSTADSMVYDTRGLLTKSARRRLVTDTSLVWTQYLYDLQYRLYATVSPDGSRDSVRFVDHFTTDMRSVTGQRSRTVTDFFGKTIATFLGDSAACDTCFSAIDTMSAQYGALGNVLQTTDFSGKTRTYSYDSRGRRFKITDPDVGTIRVWYDKYNRTRLIQRGSDSTFVYYYKYDKENRLIEEGTLTNPNYSSVNTPSYPDSTVTKAIYANYRYDSYSNSTIAADTAGGLKYCKGRLTEVVDTSGYTYYYYDQRGRLGLQTTYIKNLPVTKLRFTYFANNALKRITHPDGHYTEYGYNQVGQLNLLKADTTTLIARDSVQYTTWGAIQNVNFSGNSRLKIRNLYDNLSRPTQTVAWTRYDRLFSRGYQYQNGYLTKELDLDTLQTGGTYDTTSYGQVRTFGYDYRGRLTSAWLKDPNGVAPSRAVTYQYDVSNNLTNRTVADVDTLLFTRHAETNCDSIVRYKGDSLLLFTKDARGRIVQERKYNTDPVFDWTNWYRQTTYEYDYRNLLIRATFQLKNPPLAGDAPDTVINLYDYAGRKVRQTYIYQMWIPPDTGGVVIDALPPSGEGDLSLDQASLGSVIDGPGGTGYWQRKETSRYYVWSGNQVVWEYDGATGGASHNIYALGRLLARRMWGADSLDIFISDYIQNVRSTVRYNGVASDRLLEYYPYGEPYSGNWQNLAHRSFLSKEDDQVRELDFGPRYYSREMGRFLSPDPILSGPSPYSYAEGNPVMMWDPSGLRGAYAFMTESRRQKMIAERTNRELAAVEQQRQYEARQRAGGDSYTQVDQWGNTEYTYIPGKGAIRGGVEYDETTIEKGDYKPKGHLEKQYKNVPVPGYKDEDGYDVITVNERLEWVWVPDKATSEDRQIIDGDAYKTSVGAEGMAAGALVVETGSVLVIQSGSWIATGTTGFEVAAGVIGVTMGVGLVVLGGVVIYFVYEEFFTEPEPIMQVPQDAPR